MLDNQFTFLKGLIEKRIEGINSRRIYYRKCAFRAFISTAALAALNTILLGLHIDQLSIELKNTALVVSSIITIINTYNAFFNYKELWIGNNDALNRFYALKFNIQYYENGTPPLDPNQVDIFKNEYQSILDELNQTWQKSRLDNHKN